MTSRRLPSLDILRGAAVAAMIVVNHPGNWSAVFPQLQHATGNGCTFADLVFPAFIVVMGVAMGLALQPRADRAAEARSRRVLTRSLVLFAIGLTLNAVEAWPDLSDTRVPGVLQRIALTYAGAALLVFRLSHRLQAAVTGALLLLHWALLAWAGIDAASIDRALFGRHLLTAAGDPEGLLGVLPSVATALLGVQAGRWMRDQTTASRPVVPGLISAGMACLAAGAAWSTVWPMNKALWTGSFALFATGSTLLALAACELLLRLDPLRRSALRPLEWLGVNALAVYVGSELVGTLLDKPWAMHGAEPNSVKALLFWGWLATAFGDDGGEPSSLLFALAYMGAWILVAGLLYARGVRLRV